jgi:GNAT superfamily N-acetyltransferase
MIRECTQEDLVAICAIINDAALAYRGVIPADRWHEPYMPVDELEREIENGVVFWGVEAGGELVGVMGIQDRGEVTLVRHAYVRTQNRREGVGGDLLRHLEGLSTKPVLIGTWADAHWAIRFYEKHGYRVLGRPEGEALLKQYWTIPERQMATSVVLASPRWKSAQSKVERAADAQ